jgi:hypothetical protein
VPWVDAGIALTAYDIYNLIQPDALWHYAWHIAGALSLSALVLIIFFLCVYKTSQLALESFGFWNCL